MKWSTIPGKGTKGMTEMQDGVKCVNCIYYFVLPDRKMMVDGEWTYVKTGECRQTPTTFYHFTHDHWCGEFISKHSGLNFFQLQNFNRKEQ